jgi:hypothetical protein
LRRSLFQFGRPSAGCIFLLSLLAFSMAIPVWGASVTLDNYILKTSPATENEYDEDGELLIEGRPAVHTWSRGEFGHNGWLNTGGTAFAGQSGNTFDEIYRVYFGFDLRGLAGKTVQSAVLRLELFDYEGNDDAEAFSIHETSIHPMDLPEHVNEFDVLAAYADLGNTPGGGNLGTGTFSRTDKGSALEFVLNAQALSLINSAIISSMPRDRFFGLGISLNNITPDTTAPYQEGLQFALGKSQFDNQLILTYVPDSGATLGLLAVGGLFLAAYRSLRKRG